jgi:predicted nucleotidyltransferase component of viral defense system
MITQREISKRAYQERMSDRVIEKDYVLTWILLALAGSSLAELLVFKGGTALKKIYFPDYRYSEDLDFTLIGEATPDELLAGLATVLEGLAKSQGFRFDIPADRIERRAESLTVYVNFVGPLHAMAASRDIKIDITLVESLVFPVEEKTIMSEYTDRTEKRILVYSLEEVLTEKLCAIIGRTEPRDVYDAHFLMQRSEIDFYLIPAAFKEKAAAKGVDAAQLVEVLARKKPTFEKMWENRLRQQVKELPHLEQVLRELNRKLKEHELVDLA